MDVFVGTVVVAAVVAVILVLSLSYREARREAERLAQSGRVALAEATRMQEALMRPWVANADAQELFDTLPDLANGYRWEEPTRHYQVKGEATWAILRDGHDDPRALAKFWRI